MKRLIPIVLLVVSASVSLGAWDIELTSGYYGSQTLTGDERLLMTGGWTPQIWAKNTSYVEVQGTASQGIGTLLLEDSSTAYFENGVLNGFNIYDQARATFSGGSINYISSYQYTGSTSPTIPGSHITFICDVDSVNLTGNLLTGDWLDGKGSFSITLQNQSGYDSVYSNIQFIPEPATLSLLGLGGLLIRRKK